MILIDQAPGAAARERLEHPVIDADGHIIEHRPALDSFLRQAGIANGFAELAIQFAPASSAEEGSRLRKIRGPWWSLPASNTTDLATAIMPKLLYSRLDELGIDFAVLYPSVGVTFPHLAVEDHRRMACRALNNYLAEIFAGLEDRLTPAAVIPMYTPEEAMEELDYVVGTLGLKAVVIGSYAARVIEGELPPGTDATWLDTFGLDSVYDYDPFWARCVEVGVSPATHSSGMGWGSRRSVSSYMYNHIGHFAAAAEALAKSLFLGGVTYRFPRLRVAFLEAGSAWATSLFADLVARWEKRNIDAVRRYDPASIDRAELKRLFEEYAGTLAGFGGDVGIGKDLSEPVDDFAACGITVPGDVRDRFVPSFFFGAEADDPLTALAFDSDLNPFGARLNAMFSSDIGHWDVPDMRTVMVEACEHLDEGRMDPAAFRDFAFANAARLYAESNPDFFTGTAVEAEVAELMAGRNLPLSPGSPR